MAQAFRRFGGRVTVIEQARSYAPREDPDVAEAVRRSLWTTGIDVVLEAAIDAIDGGSGDQVGVRLRAPAGEREIDGSDLSSLSDARLIRAASGLESAGVELDLRGYVKVNERLETTALEFGRWRMCREPAIHPRRIRRLPGVPRQIWRDRSRTTRDRLIPYCMFIDPELGGSGSGGGGERARDCDPSGTLPMNRSFVPEPSARQRGFMKALIDARSDRILAHDARLRRRRVIAAVQIACCRPSIH